MMGHGPQILFSTYARVIAELRGQQATPAGDRIKAARVNAEGERRARYNQLYADGRARELHVKKWVA